MSDQIILGVVVAEPKLRATTGVEGRPPVQVRNFRVAEQVLDEAGTRWNTGRVIYVGDFYLAEPAPGAGDVVRIRTGGVSPVPWENNGIGGISVRATLRRGGLEILERALRSEQLPLI